MSRASTPGVTSANLYVPFDPSRERIPRLVAWSLLVAGAAWLAISVFTGDAGVGRAEITAPVTDLAGVISPHDERIIGDALRAHRDATGVQMAVLTVPTTGGLPIEDFSFDVAERWGGGQAGRDDGVLFTLAVEDRRMRLEVGRGLEEQITDGEAAAIIGELPELLRSGHYGAAAGRVVDRVIGETGGEAAIESALPLAEAPGLPAGGLAGALSRAFGHGIGVASVLLTLGLLLALWLVLLRLYQPRGRVAAAKRARYFEDISPWPFLAVLLVAGAPLVAGLIQAFAHDAGGATVSVPITVGVLGLLVGLPLVTWARKASLRHWRAQPRGCSEQDGMMRRVDPEGPDGGLEPGQLTEIAILSRVYDVWLCPNGHRAVEGFRGAQPAESCPQCVNATVRKGGWVTVEAPTYSSSGLRQRDVQCLHCDYTHVESQRIPRKQRSSSSSSGGGWSSGGSSGGGWSGGGGSFGGGGASGSW